MPRMRLMGLALILLLATPVWSIGPGDPAPDFTLLDVNGVAFRLSDELGKVVLLAFVGYG